MTMSAHATPIALAPTPSKPTNAGDYAHERRQDPSRINLGPLTTVTWKPWPACANIYPNCETCTVAYAAQTCIGQGPGSMTDMKLCFPPRSSGAFSPTGALKGWGIYSPGIVCPAGFTSVAESTYGSNNFGFQFPLQTGETAVGCCPTPGPALDGQSSFTATLQNGFQSCKLVVSDGMGAKVGSCVATDKPSFTSKQFPFTGTGQAAAVVASLEVLAPMVQVVWQSTDLAAGVSGPNGVAAGGNGSGSTKLGAGAQAGIGIAVALVAIALAILAFWWRRRSQRRKRGANGDEIGDDGTSGGKKDSIFSRFSSSRSSPEKQHAQTANTNSPEGLAEAGNTEIAQLEDDTGRLEAGRGNRTGGSDATRSSGVRRLNEDPVELAA